MYHYYIHEKVQMPRECKIGTSGRLWDIRKAHYWVFSFPFH